MCDRDHSKDELEMYEARGLVTRKQFGVMLGAGIAMMLGFMVCHMLVLSWADYSYVMPASAFGYVAVTFVGMTLLGETVSPRRWVGVALICVGVFLVGQTKPSTSAVAEAVQ